MKKSLPRINNKARFIPGIFFFCSGIYLFISSFNHFIVKASPYAFSSAPPEIEHSRTVSYPKQLTIPGIQLSLPIEESSITNGKWQVRNSVVNHLVSSAFPSEEGNIVLYGHNTWSVFGSLNNLSIGSAIEITTEDTVKHTYTVVSRQIVNPTDISVISPTLDERVTIYTCTGFLDSKRLVFQAVKSF